MRATLRTRAEPQQRLAESHKYPVNAVLIIDKPPGLTSHDVVARVRRICRERSVGHLGTLDPMATGVLPLVLGKMTRLAQFFTDAEKRYEGTIRFGFATDTYDAEGEPTTSPHPVTVDLAALDRLAAALRGRITQTPPPFSAKKINGVPAYKLARKDTHVQLRPVEVEVKEFKLLPADAPDLISFQATVSSGTYIRSLAHELGRLSGHGAHLASLRRTRAGIFRLEDVITLEQLEQELSTHNAPPASDSTRLGVHPRAILPEMPAVTADQQMLARIRHGNAVNLPDLSSAKLVKVFAGQSDLVAIAQRMAGTLFQPKIVLM